MKKVFPSTKYKKDLKKYAKQPSKMKGLLEIYFSHMLTNGLFLPFLHTLWDLCQKDLAITNICCNFVGNNLTQRE